jgi:hypothetical protein
VQCFTTLFKFLKEFLSVTSGLYRRSSLYVFLYGLPVPLVQLKSLQESKFLLLRPPAVIFKLRWFAEFVVALE